MAYASTGSGHALARQAVEVWSSGPFHSITANGAVPQSSMRTSTTSVAHLRARALGRDERGRRGQREGRSRPSLIKDRIRIIRSPLPMVNPYSRLWSAVIEWFFGRSKGRFPNDQPYRPSSSMRRLMDFLPRRALEIGSCRPMLHPVLVSELRHHQHYYPPVTS